MKKIKQFKMLSRYSDYIMWEFIRVDKVYDRMSKIGIYKH